MIKEAYPVGNGRLGVLPAGEPGAEVLSFNLDSLWTSGPFENSSYSGGNPPAAVSSALPGIRDYIFEHGSGNVSALLGAISSYGTYTVLANLTVDVDGVSNSTSSYNRELDLSQALHTTSFQSDGHSYSTETFCSHPDKVCVHQVKSQNLGDVTFGFENIYLNDSLYSVSCSGSELVLSGNLADPGMQFVAVARVVGSQSASCSGNKLVVHGGKSNSWGHHWKSNSEKSVAVVVNAGTNYDKTHGDAEHDYSFKGSDPTNWVKKIVSYAARKSVSKLRKSHVSDYKSLFDTFTLSLPDTKNSASSETGNLVEGYSYADGDPYLESLIFDYGRYLLISSSRDDSLPANLQGKWAPTSTPDWSSDYHANINLQMNYWLAPQTGLGSLLEPLWSFMTDTWVPYGEKTAQLLYGAESGSWVLHDEINTFGYTAMKDSAGWANYPAAAAWMMQHVFNWYEYSSDTDWYRTVGYPLAKGVAKFWLNQLVEDEYFKDGTLVANPCNSPEHGTTTFGCANFQQLIYEVYDRILALWDESGDNDEDFRSSVEKTMKQMDTGIHIGSWGQLQEWKIDEDVRNDTHRHLSHLVGWYPGYSISGIQGDNKTVLDAVETSLWSRGNGSYPTNAGWGKVWRSACWAGLNNTYMAYYQLKFALASNFANNGLSMYTAHDPPFQIDANFGFSAAVLSMLVRDLPQQYGDDSTHTIVIGPAIPAAWSGGSVSGLRLRGGGRISFTITDDGVDNIHISGRSASLRVITPDGTVVKTV